MHGNKEMAKVLVGITGNDNVNQELEGKIMTFSFQWPKFKQLHSVQINCDELLQPIMIESMTY